MTHCPMMKPQLGTPKARERPAGYSYAAVALQRPSQITAQALLRNLTIVTHDPRIIEAHCYADGSGDRQTEG